MISHKVFFKITFRGSHVFNIQLTIYQRKVEVFIYQLMHKRVALNKC